jgi:DNA-binding transcriptional regulator YiaG
LSSPLYVASEGTAEHMTTGNNTMAKDPDTMTAAEFSRLLRQLDLSVYASRVALGVSLRQAQRYAAGETEIPAPVAKLLRMYARHGLPSA